MNVLQRSTVLLVSAVAVCIAGLFIGIILRKNRVNLKRKDTEILYRDELFQKLSMNVDDVFLMLDAKNISGRLRQSQCGKNCWELQ